MIGPRRRGAVGLGRAVRLQKECDVSGLDRARGWECYVWAFLIYARFSFVFPYVFHIW